MESEENGDLVAGDEINQEKATETAAEEKEENIGANNAGESTGFRVKNVTEINIAIGEAEAETATENEASTSNGVVKKRKLPAWMLDKDMQDETAEHNEENAEPVGVQEEDEGSSEKKCKIEEAEEEQSNEASISIVKNEPEETDDVANVASTSGATSTNTTSTPPKPAIKVEKADASSTSRESCRYGIRCFRRNPMHRLEQAHPGDQDYRRPNFPQPPEGTPDCPYGDRCYRRNPIHFQEYSHPPDTDFEQNYKNRLRQRSRQRPQQQQSVSSSSQLAGDSDLDDDFEEPFLDDDESEYEPSDDNEDEFESEELLADYDDCDRAEE